MGSGRLVKRILQSHREEEIRKVVVEVMFFKVELKELTNGSDLGSDWRREIKDDSKALGLIYWRNGVA